MEHYTEFVTANTVAALRSSPDVTRGDVLLSYIQECCHCEKKLAHLLFDFSVIPEVLLTQRTMIVDNRFRPSHSVYNT